MRKILIKDLKIPLFFSIIVIIPLILLWNVKNSTELFPVAVFVQISFTFVIMILSVLLNEQNEDTDNGYKFFQTLPVRKCEVTFVKFIIPIIILVYLGLINNLIYRIFSSGVEALKLSNSITIVFSIFFLLNSGIVILGIYIFGYTKFIQITSILISVIVFGSFLISKLFGFEEKTLGDIAITIEKWLMNGDHYLFILGGLLIYIVMGVLANRIEKKS